MLDAPVSHAATADNSVTLNFNGKEEKLRLINNKVHVAAVKEAFNLKTVQLNGQLEPVDQLGFTVAEYAPGQTIMISGSPIAGGHSCKNPPSLIITYKRTHQIIGHTSSNTVSSS